MSGDLECNVSSLHKFAKSEGLLLPATLIRGKWTTRQLLGSTGGHTYGPTESIRGCLTG